MAIDVKFLFPRKNIFLFPWESYIVYRTCPEAKSKVPDWEIKLTWHRVAHGKCAGVDSGVDIRSHC